MKENKIKKLIGKKVAPLAIRLTRAEVNSTCVLFAYQPKLPESASKLKKN